jgi:hypothetical protein
MRFFIEIPDAFVDKLRDQARAVHRPPRYHAGWLLMQALQGQEMEATDSIREHEESRENDPQETAVGL